MNSKDSKEPPAEDGQKNARKPRGMGGVILILALLIDLKRSKADITRA